MIQMMDLHADKGSKRIQEEARTSGGGAAEQQQKRQE